MGVREENMLGRSARMGVRVAQGTQKSPELFGTLAKAVPALHLDSPLSQAVKLGACRRPRSAARVGARAESSTSGAVSQQRQGQDALPL